MLKTSNQMGCIVKKDKELTNVFKDLLIDMCPLIQTALFQNHFLKRT